VRSAMRSPGTGDRLMSETGLASCGHMAGPDGECGCSWWPERAPAYALAPVCQCYSCGGECGGTEHLDSCGPATPFHRGVLCLHCRLNYGNVYDDDRTPARVTIGQDRIRLAVGGGAPGAVIWLNLDDAGDLAADLLAHMVLLQIQRPT
jgi:hypothetical protein